MTILLSNIFFTPQMARSETKAGLDTVVSDMEKEIEKVLTGKISEQKAIQKIRLLIKSIAHKNLIRNKTLNMANKAYLAGKKETALFLISSVHRKVAGLKAATLQDNFKYAFNILKGTPYGNGYIHTDGTLKMRDNTKNKQDKSASKNIQGLNCMTMNNILINLIVGAREYTPQLATDPNKKGKTNEDVFTKKELSREGVYAFPIISDCLIDKIDRLSGLLDMYGNYFAVQMYSASSGKPFHSVFISRDKNEYRVLDTLAPGGTFNDSGNFNSFIRKYGNNYKLTINLVDTEKVKHLKNVKKNSFLYNLKKSIEQARLEFKP